MAKLITLDEAVKITHAFQNSEIGKDQTISGIIAVLLRNSKKFKLNNMKKMLFLFMVVLSSTSVKATVVPNLNNSKVKNSESAFCFVESKKIDKTYVANEIGVISFTVHLPLGIPGMTLDVTVSMTTSGSILDGTFSATGTCSGTISFAGFGFQLWSINFRQAVISNCKDCDYSSQISNLELGEYENVFLISNECTNPEILAKTGFKDVSELEPYIKEAVFNSELIKSLSLSYIKESLIKN